MTHVTLNDALSLVANHMDPLKHKVSKVQKGELPGGYGNVRLISLNDADTEILFWLKVDEHSYVLKLAKQENSGNRADFAFLFDNIDEPFKTYSAEGRYELCSFVPTLTNPDGVEYILQENSKFLNGILDDPEMLSRLAFNIRIYERKEKKSYVHDEVVVVIEKAKDLNQLGGGLIQLFVGYPIDVSEIETHP